MEISQCKSVVQSLFKEVGNLSTHRDDQQLVFNRKKYCIRPDDTYIFPHTVITIEYENNKRPVENISKFVNAQTLLGMVKKLKSGG